LQELFLQLKNLDPSHQGVVIARVKEQHHFHFWTALCALCFVHFVTIMDHVLISVWQVREQQQMQLLEQQEFPRFE